MTSWEDGFAKGYSKGKTISCTLEGMLPEELGGHSHCSYDGPYGGDEHSCGFGEGVSKGKSKGKAALSHALLTAYGKGMVKGEMKGMSKGWSMGMAAGMSKGFEKGKENKKVEGESCCVYFNDCLAFVRSLPSELQDIFNFGEHCRCYCRSCHEARWDHDVYTRGGMLYALPIGWARVSLSAGGAQAKLLRAFDDWHVAFHGTSPDALRAILGTNRLVRPGDAVAACGGEPISIRKDTGRIRKPFWRWSNYYWDWELFDPCQIFCSPSIRYCDLPLYAKPTPFTAPSGQKCMAKVALQLRLKPDSYWIGQQTVAPVADTIDPNFSNDEIEWYTDGREHGSHILTGLMVKLEPV